MTLAETLVEVIGLTKSFGAIKAVDNISLCVNRGEVLGFLGPNGAGKSTSMKMITGFLTPTSGTIKISGNDISVNPIEAKASIGYLPEGAPAYGEMTPLNFLSFIAEVRGIEKSARLSKVDEIINKIHLEQVAYQPIDTLSKGFKRRVGIAQAILHDPEILILDEPTDGLDPNQKHEIRALIKEMAAEKAILIATHILEEVESVCTKAIIISNGGVIFSGSPLELSSKSRYHNAITLVINNEDEKIIKPVIEELNKENNYIFGPFSADSFFVKAGVMSADIETNESLATGSQYDDASLEGTFVGAGVERDFGTDMFIRSEINFTKT